MNGGGVISRILDSDSLFLERRRETPSPSRETKKVSDVMYRM